LKLYYYSISNLLFIVYIDEKFLLFIPVQRRNSGPKNTSTSLQEKKTVDSNLNIFCVDVHMAPTAVCRRPPKPDPFPLRVAVINGWPLSGSHPVQRTALRYFKVFDSIQKFSFETCMTEKKFSFYTYI